MKNLVSLSEIAEQNGLTLIETTSERSGYPSHLRQALIGFDSFEQAEEIAEKTGMSIESFTKKDGWQLWFRTGNNMYEAFENGASDYGDNYNEFSKSSADTFYDEEVSMFLGEFENFEDLKEFIEKKERILSEIEAMDDDEIVIANCGHYFETIKKRSMSFYHDTNHMAIGIILRSEE